MNQAVQVARTREQETRAPAARLRGLDSLRGIAALSVVLFHYTIGYEARFGPYPAQPPFYFSHGHFGVELFFCISGFVILGTIERTANLKRFAIARFARIYPAYLVCAVISLASIRLAHINVPHLNLRAVLINATMLTGLTGAQAIDPSYWTLSYEVLFYGAAALVWSLSGVRPRMEIPSLAWLGVSLAGHLSPWVQAHRRLSLLLNVEYANLFVAGMMLYYLTQSTRTRLTLPTLSAALCFTAFPPEYNGGHLPQLSYAVMILAFVVAIWLVANTNGKFLEFRPLVFLGDISYSLYLIHQMVGLALIRLLLNAGIGTTAAIGATVAAMITLAYTLRITIEKPAERWIKAFGRKHEPA